MVNRNSPYQNILITITQGSDAGNGPASREILISSFLKYARIDRDDDDQTRNNERERDHGD